MAISDREIPPLDRDGPDRQRWLVLAHQGGDVDAFPAIVRDNYPGLAAHAARRLGDPRAAEDAVQETLLRAYRGLVSFNGDYHLRAWLHRILDNVCTDEGCRRKRESDANERWMAMPAESGVSAEEAAEVSVARDQVARAIAQLPPSYREALVLRDIYELEYADVASRAGITEQNARARVHRARAALRRLVEGTAGIGAVVRGVRRATRWMPRLAQHVSNTATAVSEAANLPARAGYAITAVATTSAAAAVIAGPLLGGSLGASTQPPPAIVVSTPTAPPTSATGSVTVGPARWAAVAPSFAAAATTTAPPTTTSPATTTTEAAKVAVAPPAGTSPGAPTAPTVLAEVDSSRVIVDAAGGTTEEAADITIGTAAPLAGSLSTTLVLPAASGPACTGSLAGRFYWSAPSGSSGASRLSLTTVLISDSSQPGATVYELRGTGVVTGGSGGFAGDTDVTGTVTVPDDGSLGSVHLVFTGPSGGPAPTPCPASASTSTTAAPTTTSPPSTTTSTPALASAAAS